jgi:hypothetical protein
MNEMAESLSLAGAAIVGFDIDSLEERIRNQESLCARILALDARLESLHFRQSVAATQSKSLSFRATGAEEDQSLSLALARLEEAHRRVKALNATHAELLYRSRRTVQALAHAYQSVSVETYSNPAKRVVPAEERV